MLVPEGKMRINFSGGRTSAFMLRRLLDVCGGDWPDEWRVIFANTGKEMAGTLDFVRDVEEQWGIPITWVEFDRGRLPDGRNKYMFKIVDYDTASRNGEPFEKIIRIKRTLPNVVRRFCTGELKVVPGMKVCRDVFGWTKWGNMLGIRADERRRVRPSRDKHWINHYPLVGIGVTKNDVADFWAKQGFDLRLPTYNGNNYLGNCDGCFLKSEESTALFMRSHPDLAKWWERMEAETGVTFNKRWSRKDLAEKIANQPDMVFDMEGHFCQATDGECIDG